MRFAAFVMTYHRPRELALTLETLLEQSLRPESIVVVDNGSSPETEDVVAGLKSARYLDAGGNLGPAGGAALGLRTLVEEGCDWIYWGDDDDPPRTPDTFERLLGLMESEGDPIGGLGAVGARWSWRRGRLERFTDEELRTPLEVDSIAGGSQFVLSAAALREVGYPEASLFFGLEELELCLRLRRAGYRLLVDGELMLEYRRQAGRLGLRESVHLVPRTPHEQLWRQYYSTRNYVFMMRTTFDRPDLARRFALRAAAKSVTAGARGLRYAATHARLQLRAIKDGYAGRMGRTLEK